MLYIKPFNNLILNNYVYAFCLTETEQLYFFLTYNNSLITVHLNVNLQKPVLFETLLFTHTFKTCLPPPREV